MRCTQWFAEAAAPGRRALPTTRDAVTVIWLKTTDSGSTMTTAGTRLSKASLPNPRMYSPKALGALSPLDFNE